MKHKTAWFRIIVFFVVLPVVLGMALAAFGQPTNVSPPAGVPSNVAVEVGYINADASLLTGTLSSSNSVSASTNAPVELPPGMKQAVAMLGPWLQALVTKAIVIFGSIGVVIAPFAPWIRRKIWDWMNSVAESSDTDDDVYLERLFSNPAYKFVAFLLRFARVDLPTSADLTRALQLQKEAIDEAIDAPVSAGGS